MGIENVKHIIAVASGKGGVGKSTTAVNIALALHKLGKAVGVLDADIYGPSQALMLGQENTRPEMRDQQTMIPIEAHGIYSMSMAYLVTNQTPMVWRGPMASGALQQMLLQTDWPDLDILVVDMPPGTGDIQLTLAQKAKVTGAIIVTTPQDIALLDAIRRPSLAKAVATGRQRWPPEGVQQGNILLDAIKGIEMFRKVNIPVFGIVENMAVHICSQCGHQEAIFGEGGGDRAAESYQTEVLGRLPLSLGIREQADSGTPTVVAEPDGELAKPYFEIAGKVIARLEGGVVDAAMPTISIEDD